jgi:hypothetical protein
MSGSVAPRRKQALEALQTHWLSLSKLKAAIQASDVLGLAESMQEMESTAIILSTCVHEFFLALRGVKTLLQRIEEETGCDLSPLAVARDLRLRALYEDILKARGTPEHAAAKEIFAAFVRREHP